VVQTLSSTVVDLNQKTYQRLKAALELNLRRQVFVAVCDNIVLRDRFAAELEEDLSGQLSYRASRMAGRRTSYPQLVTLNLDVSHPDPIAQVSQWLRQFPPPMNRHNRLLMPAFQIIGIEQLSRESASIQWLFLNHLRNIEHSLPALESSLLLWVTRPWSRMIPQSAPDFWHCRTAVFDFIGEPTPWVSMPETFPISSPSQPSSWKQTHHSAELSNSQFKQEGEIIQREPLPEDHIQQESPQDNEEDLTVTCHEPTESGHGYQAEVPLDNLDNADEGQSTSLPTNQDSDQSVNLDINQDIDRSIDESLVNEPSAPASQPTRPPLHIDPLTLLPDEGPDEAGEEPNDVIQSLNLEAENLEAEHEEDVLTDIPLPPSESELAQAVEALATEDLTGETVVGEPWIEHPEDTDHENLELEHLTIEDSGEESEYDVSTSGVDTQNTESLEAEIHRIESLETESLETENLETENLETEPLDLSSLDGNTTTEELPEAKTPQEDTVEVETFDFNDDAIDTNDGVTEDVPQRATFSLKALLANDTDDNLTDDVSDDDVSDNVANDAPQEQELIPLTEEAESLVIEEEEDIVLDIFDAEPSFLQSSIPSDPGLGFSLTGQSPAQQSWLEAMMAEAFQDEIGRAHV